jgi:hypothetical protein
LGDPPNHPHSTSPNSPTEVFSSGDSRLIFEIRFSVFINYQKKTKTKKSSTLSYKNKILKKIGSIEFFFLKHEISIEIPTGIST